jgi:hypothetical protein
MLLGSGQGGRFSVTVVVVILRGSLLLRYETILESWVEELCDEEV